MRQSGSVFLERTILISALLLMMGIVGTGLYESHRAKRIDLLGKSEILVMASRSINDLDRLRLAATRAKLGDPALGNELMLSFDIATSRMAYMRHELSTASHESKLQAMYEKSLLSFERVERIMQKGYCDRGCIAAELLPAIHNVRRTLIRMRGIGLKKQADAHDTMSKLHTETIRKIFGTAALFTLLMVILTVHLKLQNASFLKAKRRAEESERRVLEVSDYRARFLAGMSHEFRTPLNAIKGFSQLLLLPDMTVTEQVQREYLQDIEKSACDLEKMTNSVLDMAKIDAGTFELYEEVVDLEDLTREVQRQFDMQGDRLRVDTPGTPLLLLLDRAAIKRCIQNLISNALKFSLDEVRLVISENETHILIAVTDEGCGIPEEEIAFVWSPYRRSSFTRYSDMQGTGLGLPITKQLVELHGGTVDLVSRLDVGTEITIQLPRSRVIEGDGSASAPWAMQDNAMPERHVSALQHLAH